jgi:DNA adenine methylase
MAGGRGAPDPDMNHGIIPYVGGKHRLAYRLVEHCRTAAPKEDLFVDVFGGSASVLIAAADSFPKLVYNDLDGDLCNLFRVLARPCDRVRLFRMMRALPVSRQIFNEDHSEYVGNGFSFHRTADPVERARKTLYRHLMSFGGKTRSGGFCPSCGDRHRIKEVQRYRNVLRKIVKVGQLFQSAVIENLHYSELLEMYGARDNAVLFIDPPYDGTEALYSRGFSRTDHVFLAQQLACVRAKVVCTYYRTPMIEDLYPESAWQWTSIQATKNCAFIKGNKTLTNEWVLVRRPGRGLPGTAS